MSSLSPLSTTELEEVTGGLALALSGFTLVKLNAAQTNQAAANVGLVTIVTLQNNNQSSNIAQA
jgi:hypothetical protein